MRIWNAGLCNIEGCLRYRSLLWHGDELVGHHAHCCCMCRRTNGREHAYYCREDGHFYLKDDGSAYSQVFVEDNGKAAADAAWYGRTWWEDPAWGKPWSEEVVPDPSVKEDQPAEADEAEEKPDENPSSEEWPPRTAE